MCSDERIGMTMGYTGRASRKEVIVHTCLSIPEPVDNSQFTGIQEANIYSMAR